MIREHLDSLTGELQNVGVRLKPLIVVSVPGVEPDTAAKGWRDLVLPLTQRALSLNAELQEALIASSGNRTAAQLRGVIVSDLQWLEHGLEAPRREAAPDFLNDEQRSTTK